MKAINIVLDFADPTSPIFVEIENDEGASVKIGEYSTGDDGYMYLRITPKDIEDK